MPIDSAAALRPTATATDAAPASAVIPEASSARSDTVDAWMPPLPSPSMVALMSVAILFSVVTPEPDRPKPFLPPRPTAAEAATTTASMDCLARAVTASAPEAVMLESSSRAWTSAALTRPMPSNATRP